MKTISRIVLLVLAVVTLATLLFGIGTIPLRDPYEAAYGEVAREMAQAGSYLSPRLFDQFLPGVPPLSYVLSAFCVRIFGATEWAVRLPSALLLAALTVLLYAAVTHTFNERAGFWSGMVFATSLLTSYFVKTSVTDSTLVFFVTAALLCFIRGHYWLLYVAAALSVLSDGPIALVFPAIIIGLYLLLSGKMYLLGRMHFFGESCWFSSFALPGLFSSSMSMGLPSRRPFWLSPISACRSWPRRLSWNRCGSTCRSFWEESSPGQAFWSNP